jgi:hypothetical protein
MNYVDIKKNLQQGMLQQKFEGYELREDGILMYIDDKNRNEDFARKVLLKPII